MSTSGRTMSGEKRIFGGDLLVGIDCQDEMPHAYCNHSKQPNKSPANEIQEDWLLEYRSRPRLFDDALYTPCLAKRIKGSTSSLILGRRKLIYQCFQVFSILIIGVSVYALVENIKYLIRTYDVNKHEVSKASQKHININEELQSWVVNDYNQIAVKDKDEPDLSQNKSTSPVTKLLASVSNIPFKINNASICKTGANASDDGAEAIYFMIIVHSSPENFEYRQSIRRTWGSIKSFKNQSFRLMFLMGERLGATFQEQSAITRESELFGDIVCASYVDSYRNLTYKHLLAYKWAIDYCPHSKLILKADDDVFIDIFQLFDFISRTHGLEPDLSSLICNVYPEGTTAIRSSDAVGTKWAVSKDEYPWSIYPKYCGGLAYLATPTVIKKIYDVSEKVKFFWIDDVFVTGVLRELAGIELFYLNLRYSYDPEDNRRWLNQNKNTTSPTGIKSTSKFPFIISHVERGEKFGDEMNQLWRKTVTAWPVKHQ